MRGHIGQGVLQGIGATLKIAGTFCVVGGPFTLAVCGLVIYAYPGAALGALAGASVFGGLVGGLVGTAKCPAAPAGTIPPTEPPASPAAPADPAPEPGAEPTGGSPGVTWLHGGAFRLADPRAAG